MLYNHWILCQPIPTMPVLVSQLVGGGGGGASSTELATSDCLPQSSHNEEPHADSCLLSLIGAHAALHTAG